MLRFAVILFATILAGLVSAQNSTTSGYRYSINPGTVEQGTRYGWCNAQRNSCREVCGGGALRARCDDGTLEYECECPNGQQPDLTQYRDTIPYFMCTEYKAQCVAKTDNAYQQRQCNNTPCGTREPSNASTGGSSSGSTSTPSPSSSSSGSSGASASDSSSQTGLASSLHVGESYGLGLAACAAVALFSFGFGFTMGL
ncbi:MAG: hypothetical protein M1831_002569 [Alyxoria varia]|nr:MAG: hypothetical protein M1831_002569 [Alyxoria varia]